MRKRHSTGAIRRPNKLKVWLTQSADGKAHHQSCRVRKRLDGPAEGTAAADDDESTPELRPGHGHCQVETVGPTLRCSRCDQRLSTGPLAAHRDAAADGAAGAHRVVLRREDNLRAATGQPTE